MQRIRFTLAIAAVMVATSLQTDMFAQTNDDHSLETLVLFDGSSLDHFRGYQQEKIGSGWKIVDDTLMFDGTGGGDIITKQKFVDFELSFDWKVDPGANSGVMYRVTTGDSAPYLSGPEYQILDDSKHGDGGNLLTSAASLYGLYQPENKRLKPAGQWNSGKIVVRGNRVEHWLNGDRVVSAEIGSPDWKQRVADSKFKDWKKFAASPSGHICLQDHGDRVWFRNIRIKSPK
jgi:hypothetical protein